MSAETSPAPKPNRTSRPLRSNRRGFALIITITLLAFLVLLLVSLASMTRVETQVATNNRELAQARQNAIYGLQIALGQLQKYAGADQRITAPATTIFPSDNSTLTKFKDVTRGTGELYTGGPTIGQSNGYRDFATTALSRTYVTAASTYLTVTERGQWEAAQRTFWNAGRNPHHLAVLDSSLRVDRAGNPNAAPVALPAERYESNPATRFGEPKRDQIPVWLVSGVEKYEINQDAGTVRDSTGNNVLNQYLTDFSPTVPLADPTSTNNIVWLVNHTSSTNATSSVDGLDGRVKVRKQPITSSGQTLGNYAYWVGDESLKANFAVQDPYAGAAVGSVEYRNRLQVPQRLGWERIDGFTSMSFDPNNVNHPLYPLFTRVISTSQIPLLAGSLADNPTGTRGPLPRNYHHLTGLSKSLLTDTALGGLKKDLTIFLKTGTGLNSNDPIADPNLYANNDSRFNAWGPANGTANAGFPLSTSGIPTWRKLRDWYNNQSNGGAAITPNADTAPVLMYVMLQGGLSYDGVNKKLRWHWIPCIMLWNPYDVGLENATYTLDLSISPALSGLYVVKEQPSLLELQQDSGGSNWTGTEGDRTSYKFIDRGNVQRDISIPDDGPDSVNMNSAANPNAFFPKDDNPADGTTDMFGRFFYRLSKSGISNSSTYHLTAGNGPVRGAVEGKAVNHKLNPNDASDPTSNTSPHPIDRPLKFEIITSFAAGEVKVFTMGSNQEWNTTSRVPLSNSYDPVRPPSLYYPVATVENGPNSSTGIKFMFDQTARAVASPLVDFRINNEMIQEARDAFSDIRYNNMMSPIRGENYSPYLGYNDIGEDDADGDNLINRDEPSPKFIQHWRYLYNSSEFEDRMITTHAEKRDSSIWPYGATWIQPMTGPGPYGIPEGGQDQYVILERIPVFSRFNLGAKLWDAHPLVDAKRSRDGENNRAFPNIREGLGKIFYTRASDAMRWNDNQVTGSNGFALITPKNNDGTYLGLSTLPVRNAKRINSEILSLGQLQQVNLSRYFWQPAFPIANSYAGVYTDREAISGINSRRVGGGSGGYSIGNTPIHSGGPIGFIPNDSQNQMLDLSYLLNENLWERYFLSGITGNATATTAMPNGRFHPNADAFENPSGLNNFNTRAAYYYNAGALNVNSTSVEAWKALLSAFRDLRLGTGAAQNPAQTAPIARTLDPIQGNIQFTETTQASADIGSSAANKNYTKIVSGFRYLTDPMIQRLAERIVDEVRLRGPFYSVSDFVNRRLVAPSGSATPGTPWYDARTNGYVGPLSNENPNVNSDDNQVDFISPAYDPFVGLQGITGTLQRAIQLSGINGGVNDPRLGDAGTGVGAQNDRVYSIRIRNGGGAEYSNSSQHWQASGKSPIGGSSSNNSSKHTQDPTFRSHVDSEHMTAAPVGEAGQLFDGTPGFVTQGDLLAMLGPALTARGDTFVIRTYGDAVNPATGELQGRAWLEAVVQRTPEPVSRANADPVTTDFWRPTDSFGRKFKVISFRWLNESDL